VDPEALKTVAGARSHRPGQGPRASAVLAALNYLVQQKVVRERLDVDTQQRLYLLDHALPMRRVLEADAD